MCASYILVWHNYYTCFCVNSNCVPTANQKALVCGSVVSIATSEWLVPGEREGLLSGDKQEGRE